MIAGVRDGRVAAMVSYDAIADLTLHVEDYALEGRKRAITEEFVRATTIVHLRGDRLQGRGEDVVYDADLQRAQVQAGPRLELAGEWTLDSFSRHLETLDLFDRQDLGVDAWRRYRRWAFESAAADLALRQAGRPLSEALGRAPRPLDFVVSTGLGSPPSLAPVTDRIGAYPGVRFKLDSHPAWDEALIAALADTGAVAQIDFKGTYKGEWVDWETDPVLYARCAEAFPDAWLEDPDLTVPEADAALEPHRDRITWDEPIHGVADLEALPFPPRAINVKPSRIGSWRELFAVYAWCAERGIRCFGGGQSELGVGRGQIQLLAALFHPEEPNDVAPPGWDHREFPSTGLPVSPLSPEPDATGFARRS